MNFNNTIAWSLQQPQSYIPLKPTLDLSSYMQLYKPSQYPMYQPQPYPTFPLSFSPLTVPYLPMNPMNPDLTKLPISNKFQKP